MKFKVTLKHSFSFTALFLTVLLFQNCSQFESVGISGDSNILNSGTEISSGNKAILDCSKPIETESTVISRMTRKQIYLSLLDIVGLRGEEILNLLPIDSPSQKGLRNDSSQQLLFPDDGKKLFDFFAAAMDDVIAKNSPLLMSCDIVSIDCVESIIDKIAYVAHRGQPSSQILTKIKNSLFNFNTNTEKLKWGLVAVFLQPEFLFHESSAQNTNKQTLDNYKIADRLATMLWYSLPDEELLTAAKNGTLSTLAGLNAQIDRMISDPRIERFTYNFAEQWLSLDTAANNFKESEDINDELAASLINESRAMLEHIVSNDLPVAELLTANYTFANVQTASFYGLNSNNLTNEFTKIDVQPERSGIFSHAAVITGMSATGETNPTGRGYWFLKRAFCIPPDPIPGNLMDAVNNVQLDHNLPMKERLNFLSTNTACSTCHTQMDPIGIAFENFDSFGRLRTHNGPHPVDTTGELIDGSTFSNHVELMINMQNSDLYNFESCFSHHLSSIVRAQTIKKENLCTTNRLITHENMTFKEIIKSLVKSDLFLR